MEKTGGHTVRGSQSRGMIESLESGVGAWVLRRQKSFSARGDDDGFADHCLCDSNNNVMKTAKAND